MLYSSFATDAIAGLLVGVDGARQIADVLERDDLSADQKRNAVIRIVTGMIVSGALLAISYRDVKKAGERLGKMLGSEIAGKIPLSTRMTLSLFDDETLKALKGADDKHLTRLANILRDDPRSLARLIARREGLLNAIKQTGADTAHAIELTFLRQRMKTSGIPDASAARITDAVKHSNLSAKGIFDLDDDAIRKLTLADGQLAQGKPGDAMATFDGMKSVPKDSRGLLESHLAKAHGQKDPAYTRDPKAALLRDHPGLPRKQMAALHKLDDDALRILASANAEQVQMMAKVAALDTGLSTTTANRLLKELGTDVLTHKLEVAGDLLRINGQIDIHPTALATVTAKDLPVLFSATKPVDKAKLKRFTESKPYRFRFQFEANESWLDNLFRKAGLHGDPQAKKLMKSMDDAGRMRLNEPVNVRHPKGVTEELPQKAAAYALKQKPKTVREFVNHYEMYVSEYKRVRDAVRSTIDARMKGIPVGKRRIETQKRVSKALLGEEVVGYAKAFNKAVLDNLTDAAAKARYMRLQKELGKHVGTRKASTGITEANAVSEIRALPEVTFGTESAAVYHANKHYPELPKSHKTGSGNDLTKYLNSAQTTIRDGVPNVRVGQDGSLIVSFVQGYKQKPRDVNMQVIIRVDKRGRIVVATYGKI